MVPVHFLMSCTVYIGITSQQTVTHLCCDLKVSAAVQARAEPTFTKLRPDQLDLSTITSVVNTDISGSPIFGLYQELAENSLNQLTFKEKKELTVLFHVANCYRKQPSVVPYEETWSAFHCIIIFQIRSYRYCDIKLSHNFDNSCFPKST